VSRAVPPVADLVLLIVLVLAVIVAVVYCLRTSRALAERVDREMRTRGYVISHAVQRHSGSVTWVYGRYSEPMPFYLRLSNRDRIESVAGQLGIADLKVGHPEFDAAFVVRTNQPDWARAFLTPALCSRLATFESLEFIVSSMSQLLTPDYWPAERSRDLRTLWMLRTDGHLDEAAVRPYVDLARELSASVERLCADKPRTADACRATFLEAR